MMPRKLPISPSELALAPRSVTYLALRMRVEGEGANEAEAQLLWRAANDEFSEDQSTVLDVPIDGQFHLYLIRLASLPGWYWSGPVAELRLDPVSTPDAQVTIDSITFLHVDELAVSAK